MLHGHSSTNVVVQQPEPFDNWDWVFELKHDGFRALAVIEHGQCRFFSRKKHKLVGKQDLRSALVKEVHAETAIVDGGLASQITRAERSLPISCNGGTSLGTSPSICSRSTGKT